MDLEPGINRTDNLILVNAPSRSSSRFRILPTDLSKISFTTSQSGVQTMTEYLLSFTEYLHKRLSSSNR